ncbi:F-box/WD repeat-containing protein 5-like [Condylostylus longicornis]|uniref:F-box/WD repeat-containing protein 5-like n=1 Tax=Condylostylus longicornis TaxID=2530218 RepID=UPI00244DDD4C|nr:F-box/WD repeat-containing protein 5-like [Condylostylus longicornis]
MPKEVKCDYGLWETIPEEVFLKILLYLSTKDILAFGSTCKRYYKICKDDFLWRKLFRRDFKISNNLELKPGANSWGSEYKRLSINVPMILTEVLEQHSHQVLHVSFSHNGEMFATCSKDSNVIIWNSSYPCSVKNVHSMKKYTWKCTQYSQFNKTDTLLLVSGILFNSDSTQGEIAVFSIKENWSSLLCRVSNRPYDVFGTWFNDYQLLSGDFNWPNYLINKSFVWLNRTNQDSSEHRVATTQMYKFYNRNASSIRAIIVANCPWINRSNNPLKTNDSSEAQQKLLIRNIETNGNPFLSENLHRSELSENLLEHRKRCKDYRTAQNIEHSFINKFSNDCKKSSKLNMQSIDLKVDEDLENSVPKYLIFFTGSKTCLPHEIGIKRVENIEFANNSDFESSLKEEQQFEGSGSAVWDLEHNEINVPNLRNSDSVTNHFDKIDKTIDLHGHIIGMALSPDHRFLYVNSRPWPENYVITNPLEPPPIAQEIEIHVIDLRTLKPLEYILRSHKAYTPNTECFFIFLNVSDDYVASGAEDKHAYIWDRFYGICLAKYRHLDVVNSVAFNPKDPEMLVTTSDDHSIKIWRSRDKVKKLNIPFNEQATEFRKSW